MFGHATHVLESQFFRAFLALVLIVFAYSTQAQCWLEASGTQIVNASTGQPVILRAVGLGDWALQEGYMLNPQGCTGCPGTQWQMKLQYLNEGQSIGGALEEEEWAVAATDGRRDLCVC